jgi:uncharacterized protein
MNRVIHFDLQADDVDRVKKFYENVLGWKFEIAMSKDQGVGMDYWLIATGEGTGINGGLARRPAEEKNQLYTYQCTIEVADIDKAIEAIKKNGGTVLMEKSEIPKVGWFANAKDTEGNRFSLMQPTEWKPE